MNPIYFFFFSWVYTTETNKPEIRIVGNGETVLAYRKANSGQYGILIVDDNSIRFVFEDAGSASRAFKSP